VDLKTGQQYFKIAHHGIGKVLDPEKKSRKESKYLIRQGSSYHLETEDIWIDVEAMDQLITLGNKIYSEDKKFAIRAYQEAIELHEGTYLPDRLFEDWTSEERERIQLLVLGAYINLSELLVKSNPMECVRLTQEALQIDSTWEDAYRIQMEAYYHKGDRPMAIKTYKRCKKVLREEFDIDPLPETQAMFAKIMK
jgi:DNA-binding SARP family transcriptional activator